jgi:hypothetical protein
MDCRFLKIKNMNIEGGTFGGMRKRTGNGSERCSKFYTCIKIE